MNEVTEQACTALATLERAQRAAKKDVLDILKKAGYQVRPLRDPLCSPATIRIEVQLAPVIRVLPVTSERTDT